MMSLSKFEIETFLTFGYFINESTTSRLDDVSFGKNEVNYSSFNDNISTGKKLMYSIIDDNFEDHKKHTIPLSGGLDSRFLLSVLLEFTSASNISTYTFGVPSSLDYSIASDIAKKLGTNHMNINLLDYDYTQEELLETSRSFSNQTLLFYHAPLMKLKENFSNHICWSGYMGDPIAGSHLAFNDSSLSRESAKLRFVKSNIMSSYFYHMLNPDYISMLECPSIEGLSYSENLDFYYRQRNYIEPHVLFDGLKYATPFIDQRWINYMMSQSFDLRYNLKLYKAILLEYDLFKKFGVTSNYGGLINSSSHSLLFKRSLNCVKNFLLPHKSPYLNYFDVNWRLRNDLKFREIIYDNIQSLRRRGIVDSIIIDDVMKLNNHGLELILLASLEIISQSR